VKTAVVATTVGDVLGRRDRLAVPGLALSVFERGEAINWCDGITSIADPLPVTPDTLFQLGSVSKVITATAVVALVDRGMLSLDDLVGPLLPSVDFGEAERSLTVEHLLSHGGGSRGDWSLFGAARSQPRTSPRRDQLRRTPPALEARLCHLDW
jgi:CubicO group peptidase (beta-lactamase class C family)